MTKNIMDLTNENENEQLKNDLIAKTYIGDQLNKQINDFIMLNKQLMSENMQMNNENVQLKHDLKLEKENVLYLDKKCSQLSNDTNKNEKLCLQYKKRIDAIKSN